jgi:hypothetical protein
MGFNLNKSQLLHTVLAIEWIIEIAKNRGDSSVVIHKQDGEIQEERTYPKSSDPFPPEG